MGRPGRICAPPPLPLVQPNLWMVPYAWRNPPILGGRALCKAEPSICGKGTRGPHGMGGAAPQVRWFEATSPLRDLMSAPRACERVPTPPPRGPPWEG